jgi:hypothetical protein
MYASLQVQCYRSKTDKVNQGWEVIKVLIRWKQYIPAAQGTKDGSPKVVCLVDETWGGTTRQGPLFLCVSRRVDADEELANRPTDGLNARVG